MYQKIKSERSSALIMTLFGVAIVTLLSVTLFLVVRYERTSSSLGLSKARSESLADLAADVALVRVKEATEAGMANGKMWISEPGRIRVYDRANLSTPVDYDLFSNLPGPDSSLMDENNVDLNRSLTGEEYPIANPAPGNTKATMKVGWINLLSKPGEATASRDNPLVGRIAYWVDDESCKVNINTADGSKKNDLYRTLGTGEVSRSFGFGTPSEISLEALKDSSGTPLTNALAAAISDYAWQTGFNSVAEIGRVSGLPANFFKANKFNITHYSKSPEINFYGEPRIYLFPVVKLGTTGEVRITSVGAYGDGYYSNPPLFSSSHGGGSVTNDERVKRASGPIDFIYPASNNFPAPLPQYPITANYLTSSSESTSANRPYLLRAANAISGKDNAGVSFQWPAFNGVAGGPGSKYSARQIDSMAVQLFDLSNQTVMADQLSPDTIATLLHEGLTNTSSSEPRRVIGLSRNYKLTEIYIQASTSLLVQGTSPDTATVPGLQIRTDLEMYFPKYYEGVPLHKPYADTSDHQLGHPLGHGGFAGMNALDVAIYGAPTASAMGTWWQGSLLRILDQGDVNSGIDLNGNTSRKDIGIENPDPDQSNALAYHHPWALNALKTGYLGSINQPYPVQFCLTGLRDFFPFNAPGTPGTYHSRSTDYGDSIFHPAKVGVTELRIRGGLSLWSRNSGNSPEWEIAPLDGLPSPIPATVSASDAVELKKAVMPVEFNLPVPGREDYQLRVGDPLVNKFPADWKKTVGPADSEVTIHTVVGDSSQYTYMQGSQDPAFTPASGALINENGDNPEYLPAGGGDPLSVWLPRQDIRYPKQSRFPSVGALNYIRTGMIPDDLATSLENQKGTPWRSFNFSSNSSSQTVHGVNYPDWAILDLFTVPFLPQRRYLLTDTTVPPLRKLTWGGATQGKLNINNPKIPYPFSQSITGVTQVPPERTAPLEALFYGLKTSGGSPATAYSSGSDRKYTAVDQAALRLAVQNYMATNGPFLLPGQLAEVPEVNAVTYSGVAATAQSRNDLLRQVVGATTTQSNVFSVWIVAQTIKKSLPNTHYGVYEKGDTITGETRRRYTIERHLDFGKDGVPGNSIDPGSDGIVGTADDPADPDYNPVMTFPLPYHWRIISVENIQL